MLVEREKMEGVFDGVDTFTLPVMKSDIVPWCSLKCSPQVRIILGHS